MTKVCLRDLGVPGQAGRGRPRLCRQGDGASGHGATVWRGSGWTCYADPQTDTVVAGASGEV